MDKFQQKSSVMLSSDHTLVENFKVR